MTFGPQERRALRVVGQLLPREAIEGDVDDDRALPMLTPASYGFQSPFELRAAVNSSWQRLLTTWARFEQMADDGTETAPSAGTTRQNWLLPLLRELGYQAEPSTALEIDRKSYPISHQSRGVALHLVGSDMNLDRRQAGVAGAASASPHSLVQEFLNRSDAHLWAILSNGLSLRVLRDNATLTRQAFVEFRLDEIFTGQQFADFRSLWLVCHASRFEPDAIGTIPLEAWAQAAASQGVRALESLRRSVELAIEELGQGFLEHQDNSQLRRRLTNGELSASQFYEQLLRLVYRIVFLATAEARGLVPTRDDGPQGIRYQRFYSLQRVIDLAWLRIGTHHGDLWAQLRLVFGCLDGTVDGTSLGVVPLGGSLWSTAGTADLETASLENRVLFASLRHLTAVSTDGGPVRVDFGVIGSEEVGSVYESLLELEVDVDPVHRRFSLSVGTDHDRKATGSYYTPTTLVERVLDWTLDQPIRSALASDDPERALLHLKVVDPACGSGHFLVAAAHRLGGWLATVRTGESHPSQEELADAVRDVISHCIYGVDLNPMAVELSKIALWMESLSPGLPLGFLDHHIKVGNSLLGATPALISAGIPDDAFKPHDDDDKDVARSWKMQNAEARKGQSSLQLFGDGDDELLDPSPWEQLDAMPERTLDQIVLKAAALDNAGGSSDAQRRKAALWCAAFLTPKKPGNAPITTAALHTETIDQSTSDQYRTIDADQNPFHWHLEFPEVFLGPVASAETGWSGGFDVVVGNPPFLNQLETATVSSQRLSSLYRCRYPGVAKGYADTASIFLELSSQIAKRDQSWLALVQPDSILSTADARGARHSIAERGTLEVLWVAGEKVFNANVLTCVPVFRNRTAPSAGVVRRFRGGAFEQLDPFDLEINELKLMDTWAPLIADAFGVPRVSLDESLTIGDLAVATADFRDQYYGLVPFMEEARGRKPDGKQWAALVTTGLIDPAHLLWGERATKFNKQRFEAPFVDLVALKANSDLSPWAEKRLVPKVLLATQTKVLEAVVDEFGVLLPSVPVITIEPHGASPWHIAAAVMSPPATAWAATQFFGAALSSDALKLSAKQLMTLPRPHAGNEWDEAAVECRAASTSENEDDWIRHLSNSARLMCKAYRLESFESLLEWWRGRLPKWHTSTASGEDD